MKRFAVILSSVVVAFAFIAMTTSNVQAQSQQFNLSATVEKYVEVNPNFNIVDVPNQVIDPGEPGSDEAGNYGGLTGMTMEDAAYANCKVSVTYEGNNAAGDGEPILAREEVNGNGFDRLVTLVWIRHYINGDYGDPGWDRKDVWFKSDNNGASTGNWSTGSFATGKSFQFDHVPHDGEIDLTLNFDAALPHESPDFGTDNTWNQSADAGEYTATLTATYSAL